jgi:hypothetical protein
VARAFRLNDAPVTIRLKGCLDAGFFVGRQSGRLVVDRSTPCGAAAGRMRRNTSSELHKTLCRVWSATKDLAVAGSTGVA